VVDHSLDSDWPEPGSECLWDWLTCRHTPSTTPGSGCSYEHILNRHTNDFSNRGITENQIKDFIFRTLIQENPTGTKIDEFGRLTAIYKANGKQYLIGVADNGFIVTSLPFS